MKIFPAIDIMNGKAVRLTKGDYGTEEIFGDPIQIANEFFSLGATNLHVVDLDGAKSGRTDNFATVSSLASVGLKLQIGGGIRDEERIEKYLDCGAERVILGTAAIKNPTFLKCALQRYGERIAVGVDAKNGYAATDGWESVTHIPSFLYCGELAKLGVKTIVYTDIATDGMMSGTNLEAFSRLKEIDGINIIASGGVTYYEEITALKNMGIYGVILGKALYKNLLALNKAIALAEEK